MQTVDLFKRFLEIIDSLEKENVDYILIGGFAMVLYGMPRATQDLDIFIKNKKENIERLQKALFALFNDNKAFEITHSDLKDYNVIRYGTEEGFYIDVLSKLGTAFTFEDIKYNVINFDGHQVKIASVETLYKLKEKTFRAIDKTDLIFLKQLLEDKR
jgi:predicted nucleotidyltransferase